MMFSTLRNSFAYVLLSASLFACSEAPHTHGPQNPNIQMSGTVLDLTRSKLFDQRRMTRSFSPNEIDGFKLTDHRFRLALFDGVVRDFQVDRIRVLEGSGLSWFGSVDEDKYSYFSVTYRNGHAVGSALINGVSYSIQTKTNGRIELSQLGGHDDVTCDEVQEHASLKGGR